LPSKQRVAGSNPAGIANDFNQLDRHPDRSNGDRLHTGCANDQAGLPSRAQDHLGSVGGLAGLVADPRALGQARGSSPPRPRPCTFCARQQACRPSGLEHELLSPPLALHTLRERQLTPTSVSPSPSKGRTHVQSDLGHRSPRRNHRDGRLELVSGLEEKNARRTMR
jgi:hypothetical protein